VARPDSAEIPAPVRTVIAATFSSSSLSCGGITIPDPVLDNYLVLVYIARSRKAPVIDFTGYLIRVTKEN
jgi:hypothetical protein